jgi:hypothetical protein
MEKRPAGTAGNICFLSKELPHDVTPSLIYGKRFILFIVFKKNGMFSKKTSKFIPVYDIFL